MLVLSVLLAITLVLLVALYAQFRWRYRHIISAASSLPCPPALPVFGNALFFLGSISIFRKLKTEGDRSNNNYYLNSLLVGITKNIIKLTTQFKGLFCIWVGPVPVFVASNPADVQIVLNSSNTLEKDDIYSFLKPFFGNGILTGPVPIWKKYRRMISPVLHPANVERFLPVFNDVSKSLVQQLDIQGKVVDPRDGIFNLAIDAVQRVIMGRNPMDNKTKKNIQYLIHEVGSMFINRLFKVYLHIDWLFNILYRKEMDHCLERLSECVETINKEMEDEGKIRRSHPEVDQESREPQRLGIKTFADLWYNNPNDENEEHDWKDEITTMIVAATDTLIAATSFLMVTLANHPKIQDKVYEEIHEVMGDSDREVTLSDINNLTYLGQAIMESMRIHGTFPVILRRATKDTKLSECTVPAGSRIMLPLHAMGWDKEQFPDPEQFIPERFSADNQLDDDNKRHVYAFLPFSAGPRNCIGKMYAMVIMKTMMVHILRKYKVRSEVKMDEIEYELKVVMFSKNPLPLKFLSH